MGLEAMKALGSKWKKSQKMFAEDELMLNPSNL